MNDAKLRAANVQEAAKDDEIAPKSGPGHATAGDTTRPATLSSENAGNKTNPHNQQVTRSSEEKTIFVKLIQPDSGSQWEISQDAITTCVQTELRALESDDRITIEWRAAEYNHDVHCQR